MKCLWIHGTYFIKFNGDYYHHNLLPSLWEQRYLPYFSKLTICSRMKTAVSEADIRGKQLSFSGDDAHIGFEYLNVGLFPGKQDKAHIRQLLSDCDFVIIRVPSQNAYPVAEQAIKMNKPYMVEVVGCAWDAYFTHSLKGKLVAPLVALKMRQTVRRADFAQYVTREFLQSRYPCKGMCLACSDVQIELPTAALRAARQKRCETFAHRNQISLATIGAVDVRYKGQEYVLHALARLKQEGIRVHYKIIGGGNPQRLQHLVQTLDIAEMVEFTGNLTHDQVFAALDETDIYVHPSLTEGTPRAVLEAESRGCAVIGTRVGGMPEIVPNENLFGKKDVDGIIRLLQGYSGEKLAQEAKQNMDFVVSFLQENAETVRDAFMKKVCAAVHKQA